MASIRCGAKASRSHSEPVRDGGGGRGSLSPTDDRLLDMEVQLRSAQAEAQKCRAEADEQAAAAVKAERECAAVRQRCAAAEAQVAEVEEARRKLALELDEIKVRAIHSILTRAPCTVRGSTSVKGRGE